MKNLVDGYEMLRNPNHQLKTVVNIHLGKFDHDLTVLPSPGIMVNKGNHPLLWPYSNSRSVKYDIIYPDP